MNKLPSDSSNSDNEEQPLVGDKDSDQPIVTVDVTNPDQSRFPDLDSVQSTELTRGPKSRKEAIYRAIKNRHTKEVHHYALTLKSYNLKQREWHERAEKSITLSSENEDEIQKLMTFLEATHGHKLIPEDDYVISTIPTGGTNPKLLQSLIGHLSNTDRVNALIDILEFSSDDKALFNTLIERVSQEPQLFADAAATLNLATYQSAVEKLVSLIDSETKANESQFQTLLSENPWMFGSEYSEILDRRQWTRDEQQDFVVRRTTDNYIEIIEIKTTLEGKKLFNYDQSHDSYYASAELSKVIGQVQNYLEKLDNERNSILANDGEDTSKIRAKIIVGRDGDSSQMKALRRLNGHLHRIEILTFDQLLRIAQNVLKYLEGIFKPRPELVAQRYSNKSK